MIDLPTVIDVEASGFGAGSYPIEVGVAFPDGRSWCCLIRPEPGSNISQHFRLESLRTLLSDSQLEQWQDARTGVIAALGQTRHRARVDALVIQRAFHESRGAMV